MIKHLGEILNAFIIHHLTMLHRMPVVKNC